MSLPVSIGLLRHFMIDRGTETGSIIIVMGLSESFRSMVWLWLLLYMGLE